MEEKPTAAPAPTPEKDWADAVNNLEKYDADEQIAVLDNYLSQLQRALARVDG